jgi:hypothetical protein
MAISGTRPEQMPCYLPEMCDLFGLKCPLSRSGDKELAAERVIGVVHDVHADPEKSLWPAGSAQVAGVRPHCRAVRS